MMTTHLAHFILSLCDKIRHEKGIAKAKKEDQEKAATDAINAFTKHEKHIWETTSDLL